MDHQESGAGDLDPVARHGNHRRGRGRDPEDLDRHLGGMLAQQVVDRQAFEEVAARRIDVDRHRPVTDCAQRRRDAFRRHAFGPEALANDIQDRDRRLGLVICSRPQIRVPAVDDGVGDIAPNTWTAQHRDGWQFSQTHDWSLPRRSTGVSAVCTTSSSLAPPRRGRFSLSRPSSPDMKPPMRIFRRKSPLDFASICSMASRVNSKNRRRRCSCGHKVHQDPAFDPAQQPG